METISFSILINAGVKKVWHTMLDDGTYRQWTKAFGEGSYYKGNWEKGSEIQFIAPTGDGKTEGMYSKIKENVPYKYISIEHLGVVTNGVVDTTSEKVKNWASAMVNYGFSEKDGQTLLTIDMEIEASYKEMFEKMWPDALNALKILAEQ
ncbi:MAG: SRPBCC domain-containing protein [Chitinophagaceae bacterium]